MLYDYANMLRYDLGTGTGEKDGKAAKVGPGGSKMQRWRANPHDEEAERIYQTLLEIEPAHASALGELAQLAVDLRQDNDHAKLLFEQATGSAPSPSSKKAGGRGNAKRDTSDPSLPTPRTLTMHAKFLVSIRQMSAADRKFKQVSRCIAVVQTTMHLSVPTMPSCMCVVRQAMASDGTHLGTLIEYANFLIMTRANYKQVG